MSDKHASPQWHRTTRTIRARVKQMHDRGDEVTCWRCGHPLPEAETNDGKTRLVFDVGHLDPHAGEGLDNAAPEHRGKTATCIGNRAHGGRIGAAKTNAKRSNASTFRPLAWA